MYTKKLKDAIAGDLASLKTAGKFKVEQELESPQDAEVNIGGKKVIMFAANNYLGLANHPEIKNTAKEAIDKYGFGLSSVRFISGTETIHRILEKKLAKFLNVDDSILYSTNFMANLGFFATITNEALGGDGLPTGQAGKHMDAIYSDELNHASIIDAFKLCKRENVVKRIYPHGDMASLEKFLEEDKDKGYRHKIIATDGVFSMEGYLADLPKLRELADKYEALLFVDDAHAVGVLGKTGAGTAEHYGMSGQIDVLSGTFGKALGGALGGYIAGKQEIVDLLRQKSRTYLFSNSVPPSMVMASIRALDLLAESPELLGRAKENAEYFRNGVKKLGLEVLDGIHPIVPVMLHDAAKTQEVSKKLLAKGVFVVGLWFPVVPEGKARLRFQISAAHTKEELDTALAVLADVGREMKLIS